MIIHKETGILVKCGEEGELAEQITWMINHPNEREQMGMNARKKVENEYTLEIQAERYRKLYSAITNAQ